MFYFRIGLVNLIKRNKKIYYKKKESDGHIRDKVKVVLNLSNYATHIMLKSYNMLQALIHLI